MDTWSEAVNRAGFVIPMFICSPDFTHSHPEERQRAIEYETKMIRVAALLGEEGVIGRILSGQQRPEVSREQGVKYVDAIQQLIPTARELWVILGMENHYKDSQWTRPEFALSQDVSLEIVQAIDEPHHFGVQYDPSNAIVAGDDPIVLLENVKDRVVSMHASDRHLKEGITVEQFQLMEQNHQGIGHSEFLSHGVVVKGVNDYSQSFPEADLTIGYRLRTASTGWMRSRNLTFLKRMRDKYYHEDRPQVSERCRTHR